MLKQKVSVKKSAKAASVITFGKVLLSDDDAEFHVYHLREGEEPVRMIREYLNGRSRVTLTDLEEGEKYLVATFGDKIAGVATTHDVEIIAPFKLRIDTPIDHSKDFMRLDLPTDAPVPLDLARSIKASLRNGR